MSRGKRFESARRLSFYPAKSLKTKSSRHDNRGLCQQCVSSRQSRSLALASACYSCAIPGAKRTGQVDANVATADMPPLSEEVMERIREIYDRSIRLEVHHLW